MPRRIRAGADENSDALLLFAPEKPAPARPALRMSPPPPPLTVVAGRDSYARHSRRLPSAGLFAAAVMSLVAGLVVGIAGGYTSAQLPWWPTLPPSQTAVVPAQSASASTAAGVSRNDHRHAVVPPEAAGAAGTGQCGSHTRVVKGRAGTGTRTRSARCRGRHARCRFRRRGDGLARRVVTSRRRHRGARRPRRRRDAGVDQERHTGQARHWHRGAGFQPLGDVSGRRGR